MNLMRVLYLMIAITFCASLTACASGRAHENFKDTYRRLVGKNADDPSGYLMYYQELHVATKSLPNGNTEEQYRSGKGPNCRVYFEIDKASRKIVGWRYEGTEQDCVLVP